MTGPSRPPATDGRTTAATATKTSKTISTARVLGEARKYCPDHLDAGRCLGGCRSRLALGSGLILLAFAVVEWCSFARTPRRFTTGPPPSAYRLLSDQLSDYRVDVPYIQAHLHGPDSSSVLTLTTHRSCFEKKSSSQLTE
jgi:hypothetical protein